jgi:hypothetical protein
MNIYELIPKDKFDMERVLKLSDRDPVELLIIFNELLEWLQDINWPIAEELSKVLARGGDLILPYIREILDGGDEQWKFSLLVSLIRELPRDSQNKLKPDIRRIINMPTENELLEETHIIAKETMTFIEEQ